MFVHFYRESLPVVHEAQRVDYLWCHVVVLLGYRHVYLEGLTETSLFVHITINEIYGKVGTCGDSHLLWLVFCCCNSSDKDGFKYTAEARRICVFSV